MKLKALLLAAMTAAGVGASIAVADNGKGDAQGDHNKGCRDVSISGTVAPQTLTLTVSRAGDRGTSVGSTVTVTIGGTGQTVRAMIDGCSASSGSKPSVGSAASHPAASPSTLTVRSIELRVFPASKTGGDQHHHGTPTIPTTTRTAGTAIDTHP